MLILDGSEPLPVDLQLRIILCVSWSNHFLFATFRRRFPSINWKNKNRLSQKPIPKWWKVKESTL